MPLGQHERRGAEGCGGAQGRADILRVGHLVEHEQGAFRVDILERDRGQGLHLERNALVHRVRPKQPVEVARQSGRHRHVALGDYCRKPVRRVLGGKQSDDLTLGIGKRGLDRMDAE